MSLRHLPSVAFVLLLTFFSAGPDLFAAESPRVYGLDESAPMKQFFVMEEEKTTGEEVNGETAINTVVNTAPEAASEKKQPDPMIGLDEDKIVDMLDFKNMDMPDVLKLIAQKTGLNIVGGEDVKGKVTLYLNNVKLKDAFRIILDSNSLAYYWDNGIIHIMSGQEFEQRYGYKFGGNVDTRIFRLRYADVGNTVNFLNQFRSPTGKVVADPGSQTIGITESTEKLKLMEKFIKEIDLPVEEQVFELTYAPIKEVAAKVTEALTKNVGSVRFDERSNKLMVSDTPEKLKSISKMIVAFDVKRREVLIEAKIVQVILDDEHKFGVDWNALIKGISKKYHGLELASKFPAMLENAPVQGRIKIGTVDDDYSAIVQALETVGKTNILSSPRITVLNNEEAKIMVGSTEPYVTTTTTTSASGPATTAETINFIDVGVKLYVTPTIHKDDFITMKIKPEVSAVTGTLKTSNSNFIPIKESSEAETTVMVKDGSSIIIGGLIKEENIDTLNKVPGLGDVPVIRHAFRNENRDMRKTEIVIFLTPKIISGEATTP